MNIDKIIEDKERKESKKSKRIKFTLLILFTLIAIYSIYYFDLVGYFQPDMIQEKLDMYGMFAPLAFVIFYVIATIIFFPGTPLTIASGFLFGSFEGTLLTIMGATIGASIAFIFARYLGHGFIQDLLKNKFKKLDKYDTKLKENGYLTVLILRFLPIFPFNGLNFALGLTKVRFRNYVPATAMGIIPGTFVLAFFGSSLASLDASKIILAATLYLLMILSLPVYNKIMKRKNKKNGKEKI